jgi:hypothetical protein
MNMHHATAACTGHFIPAGHNVLAHDEHTSLSKHVQYLDQPRQDTVTELAGTQLALFNSPWPMVSTGSRTHLVATGIAR